MGLLLALICAAAQDAADPARELLGRLEARAASARGLRVHTHAVVDALGGDELLERACAGGRIDVAPSGALWDEGWAIWIGPERRGITSRSISTLTSGTELLQLVRSVGGFGPKMDDKRLEIRPKGGAWKEHPSLDPWLSRDRALSVDSVDPLLLYTLAPQLLRSEPELRVATTDAAFWILESRRPGRSGLITKRFTILRGNLALRRLEIEQKSSWGTWTVEFEALNFGFDREVAVPLRVFARHLGWVYKTWWSHRLERPESPPTERSREDFPEPLFASPGLLDRKALQLRHLLDPADRQPLVDLAWGDFPRAPGWHYRYFEEVGNYRWMLERLWKADPKSAVAREEWLRRPGRPGEPSAETATRDFPAPLFNQAAALLEAGRKDDAEAIARRGLAASPAAGDRLNWTSLLCAALSRGNKPAEAAASWLDLVRSFEDGHPETQLALAELALGRGLHSGFDPAKIAADKSLSSVILSIPAGDPDAVRSAAALPPARPLMAELVFAGKRSDEALARDLAAIPDVHALLASAALGKAPADACDAAIALWEKEAVCRPWTWDAWGRTTLSMIRKLRALGQAERATRVAERFVEKCAEGKVSSWLGYYRWGETVAEALLPLREAGKEERLVEILALSPDLVRRFVPRPRKDFHTLVPVMIRHLQKSRDAAEARSWIRLTNAAGIGGADLLPLLMLAGEIAPDDLWIEKALLENAATKLPLEKQEELLRRSIAGIKAGTYSDQSGGNIGMIYEQLAQAQVRAGKLVEAAATAKEMIREYPDMDSMALVNLGFAISIAGERDLARELYIAAARHNAHLRPFSAVTIIERLEPLGEHAEIFGLCVRTLTAWKSPSSRRDDFETQHLARIQTAYEMVSSKVAWPEVFKAWLAQPRTPLSKEQEALARRAIDDLNSDEIEIRNRANLILGLLPEGVVTILRTPALEGAPEVRARARAVLEQMSVDTWK